MSAISNAPQKPSDAWRTFTYATTASSVLVIGGLIFWSPIDPILKVALSIAAAWSLSNAVTLTKLLRDKQEYDDWKQENEPARVRAVKPESSAA